jgi:DNA-binding CsgD family transcriptional regulator
MADSQEYSLYHKFIEAYLPSGFKRIDRNDHLMLQVEAMTEANNQFFYISDIIQMNVIFTSNRSKQMIGIDPEEVSPYHFMEATHPDDIQRLNLGRAKIIKMAQDLFIAQKGEALLSTNYSIRNRRGKYADYLIQGYLFFTTIPYKTVFFLKVHTNIDWCKKIKHGYHYYLGNDLSYFRYPDDEFLSKGNVFSEREFEIIRSIESGMSSEEIAEKLFLSVHTVNTHRRNILEKAGKSHISDLIYELKERGLL